MECYYSIIVLTRNLQMQSCPSSRFLASVNLVLIKMTFWNCTFSKFVSFNLAPLKLVSFKFVHIKSTPFSVVFLKLQ